MLSGNEDLKEITLHIEGMHCNMCAMRMQKAFQSAKGVRVAEICLENKSARVVFEPGELTEQDLKQIIKDTGYEPV